MIFKTKISLVLILSVTIGFIFFIFYFNEVKADVKCDLPPFKITNISGSTIHFGKVETGKSKTINVNVRNDASESMRIDSRVMDGRPFFSGDHGFLTSAGGTKNFAITFRPGTDIQKRTASLQFESQSCVGKLQTFVLSGGEEIVFIDKLNHDFGENKIGDKVLQDFTVTNMTNDVAQVTYTLEGKDVADFSLSLAGSPAASLPSGESSIARITFDPKTQGDKLASLKVLAKNQANASVLDKNVSLRGKAVVIVPAPDDTPSDDTPAVSLSYTPIEEIPLVGKPSEVTAYLKGIFQFGVAAIAIVSMIAIMIGGYLYIFSAGGKTEKAKQMITNALLGLGLALTSWIIVYTINPDLVELKGIQNVNINMPNKTNVQTGIAGVNCEIQEVRWEATSAFSGNPATIVFILPQACVENSNMEELSINTRIDAVRITEIQGSGRIDDVFFSKNQGQLIPDSQYPYMLKAQWLVPTSVRVGEELYIIAQSHFTVKNGDNLASELKNSINELKILPTRFIDTCEILSAKWIDGAIFNKDASGELEYFQASADITVSPGGCNTDNNKYSLKAGLYMGKGHEMSIRSSEEIQMFPDSRFIDFPASSDTIRVTYSVPKSRLTNKKYEYNDQGGVKSWFYIKTAIVNSKDKNQQIFPSGSTVNTGNISEAKPRE